MTLPYIQEAVNAGEISPSLFGRVGLDKFKKGASTARNCYASYRGGLSSRAGTKFVGQCLQPASAASIAPEVIPFQFSVDQGIPIEVGDKYMRFVIDGAYVTETPISITALSNADPAVVSVTQSWSDGDWVYIANCQGLTELNGRIFIVAARASGSIELVSTLTGLLIDASAFGVYSGGGTAARIYTLVSPYAIADVAAIKWAQSADVMTLTHPSYAPYDLARITDNNWSLTKTSFNSVIAAPVSATASPDGGSTGSFYYQYLGTAVDAGTGQESIASPVATMTNIDISAQAGSNTINLAGVTGAGSYNFYRAPVAFGTAPVAGNLFGYVGTSRGTSFTDSNVTPDYSVTPPIHSDPFATASVLAIVMDMVGSSYSSTATTVAISSSTGVNFSGTPVIINGEIQWIVVNFGGTRYSTSDHVIFTDTTSAGTSASAHLVIGPSMGTYPSCVAYFQERRFYANTINNPDTYFASQPGAFTDMDASDPPKDDDAIIGSPWSQQVNGIQWMVNMPGGLVVLTGLGAWQLSGGGGGLAVASAITPASQDATPQAYNGCSALVRPIPINQDILYIQEKGSIARDLSYNIFANIYTGTDMTVLSNHLFEGHTVLRWDWAEEPNKLVWAVRDDGILLCLTYLKEQDVYAWTRHDTNGLFVSVCCVSEPPVNAPYFIVKRLIQNDGDPVYAYYMERMDNRIWQNIDDAWCVDAGLSYPQNTPNATLMASSAAGVPTLQQPTVAYGGTGYSDQTYAQLSDPTGTGASIVLTLTGGVVATALSTGTLTGYTNPSVTVIDPTGEGLGAIINIVSFNITILTTSAPIFTGTAGAGQAGDSVHIGAGSMSVVSFDTGSQLTAVVLRPITQTFPNDPLSTPIPAGPGDWTINAPTMTVSGLDHLEGMQVSILADGVVVAPQTVTDGSVTLLAPASTIVAGLGYAVQIQTLYADFASQVTVQGRRKSIYNAVVRVEASGLPFQVGANQPDASVQPGGANVPWINMAPFVGAFGAQSPIQPIPLYTGDIPGDIFDSLGLTNGQLAVQQLNPVPLNLLAVIPNISVGDSPSA